MLGGIVALGYACFHMHLARGATRRFDGLVSKLSSRIPTASAVVADRSGRLASAALTALPAK